MKKTILMMMLGGAWPCAADVTLPKVLTDHMVLQRGEPITVWGWADAGEKVSVTLAGTSKQTNADAEGNWKVTLPKRGLGDALTMKVKGKNEIVLKDILMGDVWLCSGQSNMEWGIGLSENPKQAIQAASHPKIRLLNVNKVKSGKPLPDVAKASGWKVCSPETISNLGDKPRKGFSSVGYFFGVHLQQELKNVPIGLIASSWGGTRIEPWTTPSGRDAIPELKGKKGDYSKLYNGMVHGLAPLRIKGAIWYQGESNRKDGALYHHKKRALVAGWREIWGKEMPFYFVQLAPFGYPKDSPEVLPVIWQAQSESNASIPHTGMAVTIDIGNPKDIHPKKKKEVGQRLALLALKDTYGKDVVAYSPTYVSHVVKRGKVVLTFKDVASGLATRDGKAPMAFEVAGSDGKFVPAKARISGSNQVTLESDGVKNPKSVRYAWSNTPVTNLMNQEGLPVPCFQAK
ncbi:sialate O-acetylesterase [Verrucomicrobiaceae bacterium N1E253]|uniref:Sialate O-acetylesterase n=1 Tax=Oceaniferula marina TaxID=2748318 RepID=A0A851GL38_9BACT|nr:sialate O-acetylesterase [Oceaniferula marina]NWK56551.1 sialate O-acetylesterase [Oceaniferula marina]